MFSTPDSSWLRPLLAGSPDPDHIISNPISERPGGAALVQLGLQDLVDGRADGRHGPAACQLPNICCLWVLQNGRV